MGACYLGMISQLELKTRYLDGLSLALDKGDSGMLVESLEWVAKAASMVETLIRARACIEVLKAGGPYSTSRIDQWNLRHPILAEEQRPFVGYIVQSVGPVIVGQLIDGTDMFRISEAMLFHLTLTDPGLVRVFLHRPDDLGEPLPASLGEGATVLNETATRDLAREFRKLRIPEISKDLGALSAWLERAIQLAPDRRVLAFWVG